MSRLLGPCRHAAWRPVRVRHSSEGSSSFLALNPCRGLGDDDLAEPFRHGTAPTWYDGAGAGPRYPRTGFRPRWERLYPPASLNRASVWSLSTACGTCPVIHSPGSAANPHPSPSVGEIRARWDMRSTTRICQRSVDHESWPTGSRLRRRRPSRHGAMVIQYRRTASPMGVPLPLRSARFCSSLSMIPPAVPSWRPGTTCARRSKGFWAGLDWRPCVSRSLRLAHRGRRLRPRALWSTPQVPVLFPPILANSAGAGLTPARFPSASRLRHPDPPFSAADGRRFPLVVIELRVVLIAWMLLAPLVRAPCHPTPLWLPRRRRQRVPELHGPALYLPTGSCARGRHHSRAPAVRGSILRVASF